MTVRRGWGGRGLSAVSIAQVSASFGTSVATLVRTPPERGEVLPASAGKPVSCVLHEVRRKGAHQHYALDLVRSQ